jgi:hypothetical protein
MRAVETFFGRLKKLNLPAEGWVACGWLKRLKNFLQPLQPFNLI